MKKNGRDILIARMNELASQGLDCRGCQGNCCTYEANSMMVTPLEALDLKLYLLESGRLDEELKQRCLDAIQKFRLDHPQGNGRRSFIRRTYTCPFFNHRELGCPLPVEVKPFGCLAFNAHHAEIKAKEYCYSEIRILEEREILNPHENELNKKLREKFTLIWDKTPLPLALIDLWDAEITSGDLQ
jgi:hypothetical protein